MVSTNRAWDIKIHLMMRRWRCCTCSPICRTCAVFTTRFHDLLHKWFGGNLETYQNLSKPIKTYESKGSSKVQSQQAIRLTSVVTLVDIHSNDQQLAESELWESDDGEEVRSPQLKQILNSESQKQRGENLRTFNQQTQGSLAYRSQPSRVCI